MRIVDLSLTLEESQSEPEPVLVEYVDHRAGAEILGKPAGIDPDSFPDGIALSLERISLNSHSGTHVDAPAHYGPLCGGKRARTIEELPLDWFFQEAVVLRCKGDRSAGPVSLEEAKREFERIGERPRKDLIVAVQTGADSRWGQPEYFTDFRGVSRAATAWMVEAGVKVIGIDSFGFDPPFAAMLDEYKATGDQNKLWPAHFYGRTREYCQIERMANLGAIPVDSGFRIACFPVKVRSAGAGWSRAVAILENHQCPQ